MTDGKQKETEFQQDKSHELAKYKLMSPTLYIGVGGSGKEVLLQLRRRILQKLWNGNRLRGMDEFPVADFLYFDTFTGKAKADEHFSEEKKVSRDPLLPLIELSDADCIQVKLKTDKYLAGRELDRYPLIAEWLPAGELKTINTDQGAGQVRAISRLLFFDQSKNLLNLIQHKVEKLQLNVGEERLSKLGMKIDTRVRIVIICSLAGGTGSGSFLDMGYFCKSVIESHKLDSVDLYALTGSVYSNLNDRVLANSYAALAELEYCMKTPIEPTDLNSYVKEWPGRLKNTAPLPFDDVFLIDNSNTALQRTGDRKHIFGMLADVFFEQIHDEQLRAMHKQISVNQQQYKIPKYSPLVAVNNNDDSNYKSDSSIQQFSRAYSALGQVTLYTEGRMEFERKTAEAAKNMIDVMFQLAEHDKHNNPTSKEVSEFLAAHMKLDSSIIFTDYPDFFVQANHTSLYDYPLIKEKLLKQGEQDLDQVIATHVNAEFNKIRESSTDLVNWKRNADKVREDRQKDIEGSADSGSTFGIYHKAIKDQCNKFYDELAGSSAGLDGKDIGVLREALFTILDNPEKGGLNYTIQLVGEIRDRITRNDGVYDKLMEMSSGFSKLAGELYAGYYARALTNLESAAAKGLFRGPNQAKADEFLKQAEESLVYILKYRLREVACREVANMFKIKVIPLLGVATESADEDQNTGSGILGEIQQGLKSVKSAISALSNEIRILSDAAYEENPLRTRIPGGNLDAEEFVAINSSFSGQSSDVLEKLGGSRILFSQLLKETGRNKFVQDLRDKAQEMMKDIENKLPSVQAVFEALAPKERKAIFSKAFSNAAPWIEADYDGKFEDFKVAQVTTYIAVENAPVFSKKFENEIKTSLPKILTGKDLTYVASSERGRMVIYTEFNGYPLNVLTALHSNWRRIYLEYSSGEQPYPLHSHKKKELFQRPTILGVDELRDLQSLLKLWLKGIGLRVLERRNEPDGRYQMDLARKPSPPDWTAVGREQLIYLSGYPGNFKYRLDGQIELIESKLTEKQKLLLAALFFYIAKLCYTRMRFDKGGDSETHQTGIAHSAANELYNEYKQAYWSSRGSKMDDDEFAEILTSLLKVKEKWSEEIEFSTNDTTHYEANLNPKPGDEDQKARNKRRLKPLSELTDARIDAWMNGESALTSVSSTAASMPPPLPTNTMQYHLAIDGKMDQQTYQLADLKKQRLSGFLTSKTLLWREGLPQWTEAGELDELSELFTISTPPPLPL